MNEALFFYKNNKNNLKKQKKKIRQKIQYSKHACTKHENIKNVHFKIYFYVRHHHI